MCPRRGGVVLIHDAGADSRQMLPLVKLWHGYGYDTLLIQSHEAGEARSYLGLAAQYDVLSAIDVLKAKTGAARIVTMGVGEGAAAALFAAQKDMKVDAVVAVSMHAETDDMMLTRAGPCLPGSCSSQSVSFFECV